MLGNVPSQAGLAWFAGIGKSHMAGLVVAQLLLSGRVVLLELAAPNSPQGSRRSCFRLQLKAGELSSWPPTRLPSWHCLNIIVSIWYTNCFILLCRWGGQRA